MPNRSRLACLPHRPVLISHSHAHLLVSAANRGDAAPGLLDRVLSGFNFGARRASNRDDEAESNREAYFGPPCAPMAALQPGGFYLEDDTAIIDIDGPLYDRGFGWGDGYDDIALALRQARESDRVARIFIRINSPGGMVDGLFDLVDEIATGAARSGGKPVRAFVAGAAFSAAYAIASACDEIVCAPEGETGSIGAVLLHFSEEAWLKRLGIEVTAIEFPEGKTEASWFKALSESAQADLQNRIQRAAELFIDHVAQYRGLDVDQIIALRARVFSASDPDDDQSAIALGLIDSIAMERIAFSQFGQTSPSAEPGSPPSDATQATSSATGLNTHSADLKGTAMTDAERLAALEKRAASGDKYAQRQLAAIRGLMGVDEDDAASTDPEDANAQAGDDEDASADEPEPEAVEDDDVEAAGEDDDAAEGDDEPQAAAAPSAKTAISILSCAEANGFGDLAKQLAETPGMTLARAKTMLASAASGKTAKAFTAPDPGVSDDIAAGSSAGLTGNADCDEALAAYAKAGGSNRLRSKAA